MYDSQIQFTLDTICPWTYLAKRRLDEALRQVRETDASSKVKFTIKFMPYRKSLPSNPTLNPHLLTSHQELYPGASQEGEDKYEWYKKSRYGDSEEKMKVYTTLMTAYGVSAGINYKFGGTVANTLNAHRVIQHFQESLGPETADKLVNSLYRQYFEEERHPSNNSTLLAACKEAGVPEKEADEVVGDESEGLQDVKMLIREQASNGIDSVPFVIIEGKRRDISVQGAQEVEDYVKALNQIVKEST